MFEIIFIILEETGNNFFVFTSKIYLYCKMFKICLAYRKIIKLLKNCIFKIKSFKSVYVQNLFIVIFNSNSRGT